MNDFGLLIAQYNSTLPTLTDGSFSELQVDSNGRLLVQADVTVLIDFLGLNGAGDSSNVLMVGTEDGTSGGIAHAVRLASNGAVIIDDGGSSITVDATDFDIRDLSAAQDNVAISDGTDQLEINADGSINITDNGGSITVDSTDLDIRNLSASQDNVAISDGTDQLEINTDGSINVKQAPDGSQEYNVSDDLTAAEDGLIDISGGGYVDMFTPISVTGGETLYIYGWQFAADGNAIGRIIVNDGTNDTVYKLSTNSTAMPSYSEHWSDSGRIEIAGAASLTVSVQVSRRGTGSSAADSASGSLHARKV